MTAELHSLGLAQPSPHPSSGMTSRNTRASLTSIKYFQTKNGNIFHSPLQLEPWRESFRQRKPSGRPPSRPPLRPLQGSPRSSHSRPQPLHPPWRPPGPWRPPRSLKKYFQTKPRTIFSSPAAAAQWRGVLLFQSARLTSAPSLMRVLTMLTCRQIMSV